MNKGLTDEEKFKVIRPILGYKKLDHNMPIVRRVSEEQLDFEKMVPMGIQNLSTKYNNENKLVLTFNYDRILERMWRDPFKYIPKLQTAMAVATPDFSVYSNMNPIEIEHNVYKNRWLGNLWQHYNIMTLPTLTWGDEYTYDICFRGVEKNSIVVISTLGCEDHEEVFLNGFNEMKKRINPPLIVVFGKMIEGMTGRFINIQYEEAFNKNKKTNNYKQLELFHEPVIFEVKDVI